MLIVWRKLEEDPWRFSRGLKEVQGSEGKKEGAFFLQSKSVAASY